MSLAPHVEPIRETSHHINLEYLSSLWTPEVETKINVVDSWVDKIFKEYVKFLP